MKNIEFEKMVRQFRERQDELILSKGHDYTVGNGDEDRLWNFKAVAGLLGITPLQALGVYWLKHILAICTYIKLGKVESEDIDGRFLDESNYNLLGRALITESSADQLRDVLGSKPAHVKKAMSTLQRRKSRDNSTSRPGRRRKLSGHRRKV